MENKVHQQFAYLGFEKGNLVPSFQSQSGDRATLLESDGKELPEIKYKNEAT